RPALGSIGCGLFSAWGSSPKGIDSREPNVPGGTTWNGPVGLGRTTNTGVCGFVVPRPVVWATAGLRVPTPSITPRATRAIHTGDSYIPATPASSVGWRRIDRHEEERRAARILDVVTRFRGDHDQGSRAGSLLLAGDAHERLALDHVDDLIAVVL